MSQRRLRLRSIRLEALQAISMSAGLSKVHACLCAPVDAQAVVMADCVTVLLS